METTAGRRSGGWRRTLLVCAALLATAFAAAAILVVTSGDDAPGHAQPDVRLGEGTYAGRDWIYGYDVDAGQAPCFKLSIDGRATGCGTYRSRVDVMKRWTGSGNPEGFYTSQLLVTEEVGSVRCLAGREPVGVVRLFEMPQGGLRPALCLVTREHLAGREWLAVAYDQGGKPLEVETALDLS